MKNKILGAFLMIAILLASCGDGCKKVECLNGGVCDEGTCMCPEGYIGDDCGEAVNAAYLGEWEMPCAGSINVIGLGQQDIPEFSSTINLESNGTPNQIVLDFTIPLVNQQINLVGNIDDNGDITFEEQEIEIPQEVIDLLIDQIGGGIPIPINSLSITIAGNGTIDEATDTLLVDIDIDGGLLLNGTINCIGVRL